MNDTAECPVDHEAIERPHSRWMAKASQEILDGRDIGEALGDYQARLEDSYSLMAEHNPDKAALNVVRKVRAAYYGAVSHIYVAQTLANMEEMRQDCRLNDFIKAGRDRNFDLQAGINNMQYHGEANAYMNTVLTLLDDGVYSLYLEPDTHYGKLYRSLAAYYPTIGEMSQLVAQVSENSNYRDFYGRKIPDFHEDTSGIQLENAMVSLQLLIGAQLALGESGPRLSPQRIGEIIRFDVETIAQFGSTNKSVMRNLEFFDYGDSHSIFNPDGSDIDIYSRLFTTEGASRYLRPRHGSLKDGPWKSSGNCPADLLLRYTDTKTKQSCQSFFQSLTMYGICVDELLQTNTGLLTIGSIAGEYTIFRPTEETPPQLLKGMAQTALNLAA